MTVEKEDWQGTILGEIFKRDMMSNSPSHNGWDVIVCGGGPAGVAAALSAARNQARTLLIEAAGCLGGMSTAGNLPAFCPYENGLLLIRGIGLEVIEELKRRGGGGRNPERVNWLPIDAETLKQVYDGLLTDAGVSLRFFTAFADVRMKDSVVKTLFTESKAGRETWSARVFVDATGDADVATRSGVQFAKGDGSGRMQPATLCFSIAGIELERANRFALEKGFDEGQPLRTWLMEAKKTALTNPGESGLWPNRRMNVQILSAADALPEAEVLGGKSEYNVWQVIKGHKYAVPEQFGACKVK